LNATLTLEQCAERLAALGDGQPVVGPRFDLLLTAQMKARKLCVGSVTQCHCTCGGQKLPPTRILLIGFGNPTADTLPMFYRFSAN
jgi:hypothetical protein